MDEIWKDIAGFENMYQVSNKQSAINRAKRWMQENEIKHAQLSVNSMITDNVLDIIDIEVDY